MEWPSYSRDKWCHTATSRGVRGSARLRIKSFELLKWRAAANRLPPVGSRLCGAYSPSSNVAVTVPFPEDLADLVGRDERCPVLLSLLL